MGVGGREMYKEYRELYFISIKKKGTKHTKTAFTFLDKRRIVILVCHARNLLDLLFLVYSLELCQILFVVLNLTL